MINIENIMNGVLAVSITANYTITNAVSGTLRIAADQARDVTLPTATTGRTIVINNASAGASNLVVKNAAGDTIATLNQNEMGWFYCVTPGTWALNCLWTVAQS